MTDRKPKNETEPPLEGSESQSQDYEVGYGKPPKSGQFKQGRSGNASGRKKAKPSVTAQLDTILNKKVWITENGKRKRVALQTIMLTTVANMAAKGDLKAFNVILDLHNSHGDKNGSTIEVDLLSEDSQDIMQDFLNEQNIGELIDGDLSVSSVDDNSDNENALNDALDEDPQGALNQNDIVDGGQDDAD